MITSDQKKHLIDTIVHREHLRPIGRIRRLLKDPLRALPYYILAAISHIKPYKISFNTLWGDKMTGFLPEANTFYYYGYCEANLTSFLLRFLKGGHIFVDVGAHIGFYSMLASHLVENTGKVFSFEPTPWTFSLLNKNTSNKSNVKIENTGISETEGIISFEDYGPGYGAYNTASDKGTMLNFKPKKVEIKTIFLDRYFSESSITPDFIKLDAEGFEYKILLGMEATLKTTRPLITLEMAGDEKWVENCRKSSDTLFASNYKSFEMSDDGYIKECELKLPYTYTNILFIPVEKIESVKHLIK